MLRFPRGRRPSTGLVPVARAPRTDARIRRNGDVRRGRIRIAGALRTGSARGAPPPTAGASLDRVPTADPCWPSHDLAALDGAQHRCRERIHRDIPGEELLEHRPEQEHADTLERGIV